jgi:hypothetical protein
MCFFSLHNEGPPINFPPAEAQKVAQGLVTGEVATATLLRSIADCFQAMASMVETGGATVQAWGAFAASADPAAQARLSAEVNKHYAGIFQALDETVGRITLSIQKYRELQHYGRGALAEGRGTDFEQSLIRLGTGGFDAMVQRRIELLRKLKSRVQILRRLQTDGAELLASNNFAEFFLWFMQPIRDLSLAVHDLYDEGIRGAQASHRAMNQTCEMLGEELPADLLSRSPMPMSAAAIGAAQNGRGASAAMVHHRS